MNEIAVLCYLDASVSTIHQILFDRLNLGSFVKTEQKLHPVDSTHKQFVGIKNNIWSNKTNDVLRLLI
jgi:hypothetical protein